MKTNIGTFIAKKHKRKEKRRKKTREKKMNILSMYKRIHKKVKYIEKEK